MWFKMHPWVFPIIIGIIGILYVIYNIGAAITSIRIQKKRRGSSYIRYTIFGWTPSSYCRAYITV